MTPPSCSQVVGIGVVQSFIAERLRPFGIDLVQPLSIAEYNRRCPNHTLQPYQHENPLGFVLGNTKALWEPFLRWLKESPARVDQNDPLDAYVESTVQQLISHISAQYCPCTARFSHCFGPLFVDMLTAAEISGLAFHDDQTHLCVHPKFGPWFALRAVLVLDMPGIPFDPAAPPRNPFPQLESAIRKQWNKLQCLGGLSNWQANWREWLALREMSGPQDTLQYKYEGDQLEYHYTKDRNILLRRISASSLSTT